MLREGYYLCVLVAVIAGLGLSAAFDIDPVRLEALTERAESTKSDCLVVMVNGKVVVDKWFGGAEPGRIEAMSATKSMVNLATGMLVKDGKIKSIDEPVHDFFPMYRGGGREKVTIRHLMEHTSGIQANRTTEDIYSEKDFLKDALSKPLTSEPGTKFFYNNRAANLLAGVVEKAAGKGLDSYLNGKLFRPLGVSIEWSQDRAGHCQGMAGLQIRPEDLAKVGDFAMRDDGRLLPKGWMTASAAPTPQSVQADDLCGRLWWPQMESTSYTIDDKLLRTWADAGIREGLISRLRPLRGKVYPDSGLYLSALIHAFDSAPKEREEINKYFTSGRVPWRTSIPSGKVVSYSARGYLGQFLVIVPAKHIVAVRMRRPKSDADAETHAFDFGEFQSLVTSLDP